MERPRLLIFASGSRHGGGSGFQNLVESTRTGMLNANIVGVVSNIERGGVKYRADELEIPFYHFKEPYTAAEYQRFVKETNAKWVALSGWLKLAKGLDPTKTINIHPGPLPEFGGKGLYGHHVHEAVMQAYQERRTRFSAVSMHFVTEEYDKGPLFFELPIFIRKDDTADSLQTRVNNAELQWQPYVTDLVVNGQIAWDGKNPSSLTVPSWYHFHKRNR